MSSCTGKAYVGTSGWSYEHWKNDFYKNIPRKDWLAYCSQRFNAIEVNATFYRSLSESTFRKWKQITPKEFRFSIKGNRYITHSKHLKQTLDAVLKEKHQTQPLGAKLSTVLWQLPKQQTINLERLQEFTQTLQKWPQTRHVIEFRHPSWFVDAVATCLQRQGVAVCLSDAPDWPMWDEVTTDLVYIRFHGHTVTYESSYSSKQLSQWANRINLWRHQGKDVYAYFDNDAACAAPYNAIELLQRVNS